MRRTLDGDLLERRVSLDGRHSSGNGGLTREWEWFEGFETGCGSEEGF